MSGKFGTSLLLTLDTNPSDIPNTLNDLYRISQEEPKFKLPKIEIIRDEARIATYDARLIEKIKSID